MNSSKEYWRKREEEHIVQVIKNEQQMKKAIAERFQVAIDNINKEIEVNWQGFAGKEGISLTEAKRLSRKMDIEAFARKAKRYVKEKDFSKTANDELRLYNVTMRVNRLELLKAQIGLELIALSDELDKYTAEMLTEEGIIEAKRQAGILGTTVFTGYKDFVATVVNASFHSATFSERIWGNIAAFKTELDKLLVKTIIQGRHPDEMARNLRNLFDASKYEAERVMRTESARVQIAIQEQSYVEYNIPEYEYIAEPTACSICAALDGKIFNVEDMMPGSNACPMHPNCRCSTVPYIDREVYKESLSKQLSDLSEKEWRNSNIPDKIKKRDIQLPKSLSAKARDIRVKKDFGVKRHPLDGSFTFKIKPGSVIKSVEVIGGKGVKRQIDDINRLVRENKGSLAKDWQKMKGIAELVDLEENYLGRYEVHWYQNKSVGKVEFKVKMR